MTKNIIQMIILTTVLIACSDRYRYPCQDPLNWNEPDCKPPICTATGTCPEQLVKPEQEKK